MKDLKNIISFAWKYIHGYKSRIYLTIGLETVYYLIVLVSTLLLGMLIDGLTYSPSVQTIMICAGTLLVSEIILFIVTYFSKIMGQKVATITSAEFSRQLAEHVQDCSLKYSGNMGTASFIQRFYYTGATLICFVENFLGHTAGMFLQGLIAVIIIFRLNWVCGVAILVELPAVAILYRAFQDKLLERQHTSAQKEENFLKSLFAMLINLRHVKINRIFDLLEVRNRQAAKENAEAAVKAVSIDFIYSMLMENVSVFLQIFLFFYGGFQILKGNMTIGSFTIIYSYFEVVNNSAAHFLELGKDIQTHKAYYERLKVIADEPEETNGTEMLQHIDRIELNNVNFKYGEDVVLKDFSCTFEKGGLYVVAGENGSGKSTMISLLLGLYIDEFTGDITYNGVPIRQLDMKKLRKERVGVCEQEPYLVTDTIRFNMKYDNDSSQDAKLMELAHQVSLDEFLQSTEKGLDTPVGENGDNLSGGQKQKTALVKVFYKDADLLVLDEPTSAMDAGGCERLIQYLESIKHDKIIIIVSHDQKLMEAADKVITLRKVTETIPSIIAHPVAHIL